MSDFRFDLASFLAGFASGSVVAFIIYRLRHWIARVRQGASERAESARRYATRTADARYQIDILRFCRSYHLPGTRVDLRDVLVEPRFIQGVETYDTTGERLLHDVFRVVPLIHQFPAGYATYNIKTIGVPDLGVGERHLALLGNTGSGRSTALAAIALWAMGELEFEATQDTVQLAIQEEEAQLSNQEREIRAKERAEIQERALAQIERAQEQAAEALGEEGQHPRVDLHRLMPILVHLGDVVIEPDNPVALDPAEPLVRAIQHNVRRVTALTVPRYVYNRLNTGQALVLLDGLDDLPAEDQVHKLAWLRRFMETYDQCTIIVAGPATGYHPLLQLGLTPLFLRPWMNLHVRTFAEHWAAAWPRFAASGRTLAEEPSERALRLASEDNNGLRPLDLLLRLFSVFGDDSQEGMRADWYNGYITRQFQMKALEGDNELADDALYAIAQLAAQIQATGAISEERLLEHLTNAMRRVEGEEGRTKETFLLDVNQFYKVLIVTSGLMVVRADGLIAFTHPLLRAFLASVTLVEPDGPVTLDMVTTDPAWADAVTFAMAIAPLEMANKAVVARLSQQPDLLFNNLFSIVEWLPGSPADAPWHGEIFKRLAAALIAPVQFPVLRERAMAALIASRDKSVLFILRQALRSTDTKVQLLGCIGLGALGESDAIKDLRPMLEDEVLDVQLAAGLALGAIGTEKAREVMVDGLLHGEEGLRQAVAEALAAIPGDGHQLLHVAISNEDMMVRRAAVFGLTRIQTSWALTDLYRALLEDDQWYVRSAAEQAFARAQQRSDTVVLAHPPLRELEWVVDWAAEHVKLPAPPENPDPDEPLPDPYTPALLVKMLESGEQPYRIASARTLGYMGYIPALPRLYRVLGDDGETVRAAAYAALSDMQVQLGSRLPSVV